MTGAIAAQGASLGRNSSADRSTGSLRDRPIAPTLKVAVVHPCDAAFVGAVIEAAELGLIEPILVGPRSKILAAAEYDIGKRHLRHAVRRGSSQP